MPKEPPQVYKTESELKAEAAKQMEEQRLLEAARKPKSERAKKAENFFYHHKGLVAVLAIAAVVIFLFVRDIFFAERADFMVIAVSANGVSHDSRDDMSGVLSRRMTEILGDTAVTMDSITLPLRRFDDYQPPADDETLGNLPDAARLEMDYANMMKLSALIAANNDPIFLLDTAAFEYFARMNEPEGVKGFLYPLNAEADDSGSGNVYSLPVERLGLSGDLAEAFAGMSFYLRDWSGDNRKAAQFAAALEFLNSLM
jgi:hypothetical protein